MGKRTWTEEQEKILIDMVRENKSFKEIAEVIDKKVPAISRKKQAMKLEYPIVQTHNSKFKAIYQDYDWCYQKFIIENKNYKEISEEANCSLRVIQKWFSEKYKLNWRTRKNILSLNKKQIDLIIGSILGDGHIDKRPKYPNFIVSNSENQKEYLYWKYDIMKNLCNKEPTYNEPFVQKFPNGKEYLCQSFYKFQTRTMNCLVEYRDLSIYERIERLNEFSLSIFFLDDGSRNKNAWELCVAMFNDEDKKLFIKLMHDKFNIDGHYKDCDNRYFRINTEESKKVTEMILKNIPNELDVVKDKIINYKYIRG
jgi:hypothetical protein